MQEHMGKKRKRELREALNLREERDKHVRKAALIIGAGVFVCALYFFCCTFNIGINFTNQLFATLDTTSRRLRFPRLEEVIFTDTVGFIRDLPQDLVAAFKATLEELNDADVLLHVIDASNPQVHSQIAAVEAILKQLKLDAKPIIRIFNKTDLIAPIDALELAHQYDGIAISAKFQSSTLPLIDRIQEFYLAQHRTAAEPQIQIRTFDD